MKTQTVMNSLEYLIKHAGDFGCENLAEVKSVSPLISGDPNADHEKRMIAIELPEGKFLITVEALQATRSKSAGEN